MAKGSVGTVQRITGPVVDVLFNVEEVPEILHALEIEVNNEVYVLEVSQHLGNGEVRCISMYPTDGISRGLKAVDTGMPITVGVGEETLGRMVNVIGQPIDMGEPINAKKRWPIHHPAPPFVDIVPS